MSDRHSANRPTAFHVIAKPIGPICNLDCRYCFYLEKDRFYPGTSEWAMSPEVAEAFVRDYIEAQDVPVVSFSWQGGEPTLLGLDFFARIVEWEARYANGRRIENAFQTNGVLVDDRWAAFLAEHHFLVGVSIDGPRAQHDRYRVDRGGRPTFDRVMHGIDALRRGGVDFNALTVVHRENARAPLEVYRFLKEAVSPFIQFIPIVERVVESSGTPAPHPSGAHRVLAQPGTSGDGSVTPWSVDPAEWGTFLCSVFDEWVRHDVGQVFVQLFDVTLESWYRGEASLCVFRETCGDALAIEHNGDVYACDHYVFPPFRIGNVATGRLRDLVASPAQRAFGLAKRDALPGYCRQCEVLHACHGECPRNRFVTSPDGESGLNYLCPGYKRFFTHVAPPMAFMAGELEHERPPANVMAWVKAADQRQQLSTAGRNDPCPCGSGKKVKHCCGR